jgi:hypothetical protein
VNISTVKELAWEAATCSPYVYLRKPVIVLVTDEFNRSFLNRFTIKAYVLDVRFERKFSSDMLERVKTALLDKKLITEELILSAFRSSASQL